MFSLLQFRALVAVAETGSLSSAAALLHRSTSAVSITLKNLEDLAGGALFEGDRKTRLTPLGRFIVNEARVLLDHNDRVAQVIRDYAQGGPGRIDIACVPSVAAAFMPEALTRLWEEFPNLTINLRDMDSRSVGEAVASGTVDVGFASRIGSRDDFQSTPFFSDPLDIVCASKDPLSERSEPVSWADLATHRFIGNGSYASFGSQEFDALCKCQVAYVPNVISLLAIVRSGLGVTVLPRLIKAESGPAIRFLPARDIAARREVFMLVRADRPLSQQTERFIFELRSIIESRSLDLGIEIL